MRQTLGSLLAEARAYTAQFQARCRESGWFGAGFHAGVQADILEDAAKVQQTVTAEIAKAQSPKSEGGEMITPREAKRIQEVLS